MEKGEPAMESEGKRWKGKEEEKGTGGGRESIASFVSKSIDLHLLTYINTSHYLR